MAGMELARFSPLRSEQVEASTTASSASDTESQPGCSIPYIKVISPLKASPLSQAPSSTSASSSPVPSRSLQEFGFSPLEHDDRLPSGWSRKLTQRKLGNSAGKFDVYIYSPGGKKFRSRTELAAYLEKTEEYSDLTVSMFDFTIRGNQAGKEFTPKPRKTPAKAKTPVEKSPKLAKSNTKKSPGVKRTSSAKSPGVKRTSSAKSVSKKSQKKSPKQNKQQKTLSQKLVVKMNFLMPNRKRPSDEEEEKTEKGDQENTGCSPPLKKQKMTTVDMDGEDMEKDTSQECVVEKLEERLAECKDDGIEGKIEAEQKFNGESSDLDNEESMETSAEASIGSVTIIVSSPKEASNANELTAQGKSPQILSVADTKLPIRSPRRKSAEKVDAEDGMPAVKSPRRKSTGTEKVETKKKKVPTATLR